MEGGPFEADPSGTNTDQFIIQIQSQLCYNGGPLDIVNDLQALDDQDLDQFLIHVSNTRELFREVMSKLKISPIPNCTISWITALSHLYEVLAALKFAMDRVLSNNSKGDFRTVSKIRQNMGQLFIDLNETQILLFSQPLDYQFISLKLCTSKKFVSVITNLFNTMLVLVEQDVAIDLGLININELKFNCTGEFVKKLFLSTTELSEYQVATKITFGLLLDIIQMMYTSGNSHVFKQVLLDANVISPELPIHLIESHELQVLDLVCFYKYVALNLVSISFDESNECLLAYNLQANGYFKCFFSFPSALYTVAQSLRRPMNKCKILPNGIILPLNKENNSNDYRNENVLERVEVSLFYLLNYIIISQDMNDLSSPSNNFVSEIDNVIFTLSDDISTRLNKDALSANTSRSSQSGLLPQLTNDHDGSRDHDEYIETLKYQSMGSIIINGTYKQRLRTVLDFWKLLRNLKISKIVNDFCLNEPSHSQLAHLMELTEVSKFPGVVKYFKFLDLITKILTLLKLKGMIKSLGSQKISESNLSNIVGDFSKLIPTLKLKHILDFLRKSVNGNDFYYFSIPQSTLGTKEEMIDRQIKLNERIKGLELS